MTDHHKPDFIHFAKPSIGEEEIAEVGRCLRSGWVTTGPMTRRFEAEFAARIAEKAFDYLDAPIKRVAQAEVPLPYAKVMEQAALPKAHNIVETIKATLDASGYRARSYR